MSLRPDEKIPEAARAFVEVLDPGSPWPDRPQPGKVYLVPNLRSLPQAVEGALVAAASADASVDGMGDGILSALVSLGEPFLFRSGVFSAANAQAIASRLLQLAPDPAARAKIEEIVLGANYARAGELQEHGPREAFRRLGAEVPILTDQILDSALVMRNFQRKGGSSFPSRSGMRPSRECCSRPRTRSKVSFSWRFAKPTMRVSKKLSPPLRWAVTSNFRPSLAKSSPKFSKAFWSRSP